jgi:hypothetical protein
MGIMAGIVDQARAAFLIRSGGGKATIRKWGGTTAAAAGTEVDAYTHYPTQKDIQEAMGLGIAIATEDTVINLLTGDSTVQAGKDDRIDIVFFDNTIKVFKVKAILKRQFPTSIGAKPLVDRALICPIPTDG